MTQLSAEPIAMPPAPPAVEALPQKMIPVLLERHYRPLTEQFEIVGHWKPAVQVKNAAGKLVEIEPRTFVKGEKMPPPLAGVGAVSPKLWAGCVVKLPVEEAKRAKREGIGTIEIDD